jgi:hypothetical protein
MLKDAADELFGGSHSIVMKLNFILSLLEKWKWKGFKQACLAIDYIRPI